jgi:hypothetical protein
MDSRDIHTRPAPGLQKLADALLGIPEPLHCELVIEIYEAIAHDLAERQRCYKTTTAVNFDRHPDYLAGWEAAVRYVTSLVDPEAPDGDQR